MKGSGSKNKLKQIKSNKLEQAATKLIKRSELTDKLKEFGKGKNAISYFADFDENETKLMVSSSKGLI